MADRARAGSFRVGQWEQSGRKDGRRCAALEGMGCWVEWRLKHLGGAGDFDQAGGRQHGDYDRAGIKFDFQITQRARSGRRFGFSGRAEGTSRNAGGGLCGSANRHDTGCVGGENKRGPQEPKRSEEDLQEPRPHLRNYRTRQTWLQGGPARLRTTHQVTLITTIVVSSVRRFNPTKRRVSQSICRQICSAGSCRCARRHSRIRCLPNFSPL